METAINIFDNESGFFRYRNELLPKWLAISNVDIRLVGSKLSSIDVFLRLYNPRNVPVVIRDFVRLILPFALRQISIEGVDTCDYCRK